MESAEVLALVGGHVEQEILLRNEYLAAENEIVAQASRNLSVVRLLATLRRPNFR